MMFRQPYLLSLIFSFLMKTSVQAVAVPSRPVRDENVTVAVYEHAPKIPSKPPVPGEERGVMASNLKAYESQAALAVGKGAKLVIFPEDGLYGFKFTRDSVKPYLEEIPDPQKGDSNPCTDIKYQSLYVQHTLSCLARNLSTYIVANVGDRVPCDPKTDNKCPTDKQFQYNTNVAYDTTGKLVAKYHKKNLYYESQFDEPEVEYSVFDTEFGRVGMMTCFDVLFKEPAIGLVEKHNIQHLAFPAAWGNAWPHLYSIQFHQAFAIRMGVNLLDSGYHNPTKGTGSGIYAGADKAKAMYFNETLGSAGGLVTGSISATPSKPLKERIPTIAPPKTTSDEFTGVVHRDTYTMVELKGLEGTVSLRTKHVTCGLSFKRTAPMTFMYVLAAFDGVHASSQSWYIQSCVLLKCANNTRGSCGTKTLYADTIFTKFDLRGQFDTHYVYPSVMSNDTKMPNSDWTYSIDQSDPKRVRIRSKLGKQPLVVASLYGRLYQGDSKAQSSDREGEKESGDLSGGARNAASWGIFHVCIILMALY